MVSIAHSCSFITIVTLFFIINKEVENNNKITIKLIFVVPRYREQFLFNFISSKQD